MVLAIATMLFENQQKASLHVTICITVIVCVAIAAQGFADRGKGQLQLLISAAEKKVIASDTINELAKTILKQQQSRSDEDK